MKERMSINDSKKFLEELGFQVVETPELTLRRLYEAYGQLRNKSQRVYMQKGIEVALNTLGYEIKGVNA